MVGTTGNCVQETNRFGVEDEIKIKKKKCYVSMGIGKWKGTRVGGFWICFWDGNDVDNDAFLFVWLRDKVRCSFALLCSCTPHWTTLSFFSLLYPLPLFLSQIAYIIYIFLI